ncbi:disease resistance protein RUN1 [Eucalyptus grandis]|uniref:disease resistance protein RUN1 n=1 Tax=Eucalyptus grandis TaxID=71139 RepID=UPI00192ECD55|nr:disease resistance protein RUN1 [Eucalyptus grandis]
MALEAREEVGEDGGDVPEETPPAAGGDSSGEFGLLYSAEEVITGRTDVVFKRDHCRKETIGRELERACDSDLKEKLRAKKDSFAAFVAPVVLSMIAYEQLHRKKACECEVFLSFSGKGALKNFADSLYKGMVDAGIGVFRNDYWLPRHEKIGLKAIKSSKISILILSRKYDSSRRCLDELVQVMKCTNDSSGHVVLPIFYRVKPADVRCEVDVCDPMVAEERKQVLKEISSLKGWESDEIAAGDEGQLVESVVRKVLIELKKALEPVITENSVGIKSPLEKIMKFLDSCSSTQYVGIHGEGGVGKTTLAKIIYNKLSQRFDHCSFIPNVAESWKCKGIEYLRNQLILDIQKKIEHGNEQLSATISSTFRNTEVLILLDDVNTNHQLKELVGDRNWFAPRSRIIITTREKSILDWAKVDYKHEHKAMEIDEAEILFARHAFRMDSLPDKFSKLSCEVLSTVRRLPLIVEVIGSYLCGKSKALWEETKEKLQESQELPRKEMQEILEILYNALKFEQKKIFLDIASFLVGSDVRTASCMWDTSDFYLEIEELIFMSLIKIGDNHELRMHDEVRDFGRSIVREGRCKEADNGRILWDSEEFLKILDEKEVENFAVKELAVLDFSRSMISEDWEGWKLIKVAVL